MKLGVQLGQSVVLVNRGFDDVTSGGGLDNVADDELFDSLVFGDAAGAVGATDCLDVAAAVLGTSVVPALARHVGRFDAVKGDAKR